MNKRNSKRKALVLSTAMAALMLSPLTMNAQYDEDRYGIQPWFGSSMLGKENSGNRDGETSFTVNSQDFGQNVPMGSGIIILLAAGAGYATLKRKEEQQ